jgi:hypothetical protein
MARGNGLCVDQRALQGYQIALLPGRENCLRHIVPESPAPPGDSTPHGVEPMWRAISSHEILAFLGERS